MKKLWMMAAAATAFAALPAVAQQSWSVQQPQTQAFSPEQLAQQDMARIDRAMNSLQSMKGRFAQYGADGSYATGQVFIQRPGKVRFEYDSPHPLLIISDGVTITQVDKELETTDKVPLSSTPLHFFLKRDISVQDDARIIDMQHTGTELHITMEDNSGEMDGKLTMVLAEPDLRLKEWTVSDSFGAKTRILLSDLTYNETLNPRLFVPPSDGIRDRRNRR